jgi:uncharacterized membrane protein YkvA (DUF1232 family)
LHPIIICLMGVMEAFIKRWKNWAYKLEWEVYALFLANKDPRTPWYAKVFTALVVGYAFSPIDLIPDFIPVLGYLDDLLLVPLGVALAIRMIPQEVMEDSRLKAADMMAEGEPVNKVAAAVIVLVWMGLAALAGWLVYRAAS